MYSIQDQWVGSTRSQCGWDPQLRELSRIGRLCGAVDLITTINFGQTKFWRIIGNWQQLIVVHAITQVPTQVLTTVANTGHVIPVVGSCCLCMKNVFFSSQLDVSTSHATITGGDPDEIRGDAPVIAVNSQMKRSSASCAARCKSPATVQTRIQPFNTW